MRVEDTPRLETILKNLAEAHDHKLVSAVALKHWYESLQPFPIHKIEVMAKQWITTHSKFPTIADFYVPLNEEAIDTREATWNAVKAQEKFEANQFVRTEQGSHVLGMLKGWFAAVGQRQPKQWAHDILDAWADQRPLQYTNPITGEKHDREYEAIVTTSTGERVIVVVKANPEPYAVKLACEATGIDYKELTAERNKRWREHLPQPKIAEPELEHEPGSAG